MAQRFRVHDLGRAAPGPLHDDLAAYLQGLHLRFRHGAQAATRVYTCRAWRAGQAAPFELGWNDEDVPGERLLGELGLAVPEPLVEAVAAELAAGEAVRLFIYNSDADLCFQEVLAPG